MRWRGSRTPPPSGQDRDGLLERMTGIEPAFSAWEVGARIPYCPVIPGHEPFLPETLPSVANVLKHASPATTLSIYAHSESVTAARDIANFVD